MLILNIFIQAISSKNNQTSNSVLRLLRLRSLLQTPRSLLHALFALQGTPHVAALLKCPLGNVVTELAGQFVVAGAWIFVVFGYGSASGDGEFARETIVHL